MVEATQRAVGLSVGATSVAAVTADTAVLKTPVLTLTEPHRAMVGLAPEYGPTVSDFVDRVGDPVGVLASDGTSHRGETLVAETLRSLTDLAVFRQPWPDVAAVTYPAHWRPRSVTALRGALGQIPEWSGASMPVVSDVAAAITALQSGPGLPTHGVLAVCDIGGSGTSITLVDAANGYQPVGATVRHLDFSGDLIDQAVLTHVIGTLAQAGAVDLASTSAIGSLRELRRNCRGAKERLSATTVTALPVVLPDYRSEVRLTRAELDDMARAPLADVLDIIEETLRRNGIRRSELVAVATVGGGAAMASVTTTLSEGLRIPVITSPRPGLAAATGAALRALRGPVTDSATVVAPAAATMAAMALSDPDPVAPSLAWSQADDIPDVVPESGFGSVTGARPQIDFIDDRDAADDSPPLPWYRRPALVLVAAAVGALAAVGGVGIVLTTDSTATSASTPVPAISSLPAVEPMPESLAAPPPAPVAVQNPQPAPIRTVTAEPPPVTRTQVARGQAPAQAPPAPATTTQPTTTTPTTTTPTTTTPTTTTQPTTQPPTTTTPPPTTTSPPPVTTTTPPPPVTETVTETVQPTPEPQPEPAPEPQQPSETPEWISVLPTIPELPPLVPAP
ncbi:Hsp70 family protein [soil metagenome]